MPEITKTEDREPRGIPKYVWILLSVLVVFVYFFGLTLPFLGPDEARYAEVGREMSQRGDWITPTLGGFSWFEKPALLYWLEILSYKVFGVNEFAARFGPALFGLGTIVSLWFLGRSVERTTNSEQRPTTNFANYLALIAASTLGLIVFSRAASFDIIITFPITAALVSFFVFDRSSETSFQKRYLPLILFYVFVGVALLAKGLIGIVFPFAIVGFFYLLSRRLPSRAFLTSLIWGTLVAIAIAAIWYFPMYERHGYQFIDEFIIQQHFQRFTSNRYQHPQPFYFFLWVLPLMTLPWLPFFFAAIWKLIKEGFHRGDVAAQSETSSPLLLFSVSWLLVPLVFFSFSGSKLPGYILPAVPAGVILAATFVHKLAVSNTKWRNTIVLLGSSTLIVVLLLLIFAVPRFAEGDSVRTLMQTANSRGYTTNRVLSIYTVSHNAEFYAAGRLVRDADGKQPKLYSADEVLTEINAGGGQPILVLVPLERLVVLTKDDRLKTLVIKDNGELAIAAVSIK